jgi:hypothetical protein
MNGKPQVQYEWTYMQDDTPVRGNALASGDDAADKECEDKIIEGLKRGDDWHWALVEVRAIISSGGQRFMGRATLGACSYGSLAELRADTFEDGGGYDLRVDALDDLKTYLKTEVYRGLTAGELLAALET